MIEIDYITVAKFAVASGAALFTSSAARVGGHGRPRASAGCTATSPGGFVCALGEHLDRSACTQAYTQATT